MVKRQSVDDTNRRTGCMIGGGRGSLDIRGYSAPKVVEVAVDVTTSKPNMAAASVLKSEDSDLCRLLSEDLTA